MAKAARTRTRYPGIYRLASGGYEYIYRNALGRQRSGTADTLDEARETKGLAEKAAQAGITVTSQLTLAEYVLDVIERYQGRTSRGFREDTRDEYRRQLKQYVIRYFGTKLKLTAVTPKRVSDFIGWLVRLNIGTETKPRHLADETIRRIKAALAVCMATAVEEGLIPMNPCLGVRLPNRPKVVTDDEEEENLDEEEQVKVLTRVELARVLRCSAPEFVVLLTFLSVTGLRISEALGLRWKNVLLDGRNPRIRVRRTYSKGRYGPPKSRFGKREVPLSPAMVEMLREHRATTAFNRDRDLVFCMDTGRPWGTNLWRPSIKAAGAAAGVPWIGFHTLRHTCASLLFAEGRNAVQVQRWLGHHSPAFTLSRYVHLLDSDLGGPLELAPVPDQGVGESGQRVQEDREPAVA